MRALVAVGRKREEDRFVACEGVGHGGACHPDRPAVQEERHKDAGQRRHHDDADDDRDKQQFERVTGGHAP